MRISGFQLESYQDWEEGLTSVVYTGKCNLRCHACHAKLLLESENHNPDKVLEKLKRKNKYIKRVTITGGEPTLEKGLERFIRELRKAGFKIKLDTNGTNPEKTKKFHEIVDYVAMDIKGPKSLYSAIVGSKINIHSIEESVKNIEKFKDYELRTTVVPVIRGEEISWISKEEAKEMGEWIYGLLKNPKETKYFVQRFIPRKNALLNPVLEKFPETPDEILEGIAEVLKTFFPNTSIRY